jgi:hypothetical protein
MMDTATGDNLPLAEWLGILEQEYLAEFIPAGGAAVKFAVACPERIPIIVRSIEEAAARHGLITVRLSAASTRVHMLQDVFFTIARQLPWDTLAQRQVEDMFARHGYAWPHHGRKATMAELADIHGIAPALLERSRDQWLSEEVWGNAALAQDFRSALMRLCLSRLGPEADATDEAEPVLQWLRGELATIGALRDVHIFTRINRNNARAMLASLCHWVRGTGAGGLAVTLDLRQILRTGAVGEGEVRYTPAAVMDAYEVLRELVDDIDDMPGLFLVVLADAALTAGEGKRVLDQYVALKARIWPDVRPGGRQNPLAPLVWVAS